MGKGGLSDGSVGWRIAGETCIGFDISADLGYNGRLNQHESEEKREVGCSSRATMASMPQPCLPRDDLL